MATVLRTPSFLPSLPLKTKSLETQRRFSCVSFAQRRLKQSQISFSSFSKKRSVWGSNWVSFAASGETTEASVVEEEDTQQEIPEDEVPLEDSSDEENVDSEEELPSAIVASLQSYKEALANDDVTKIAEIEAFFLSIEEEKISLASKLATLSTELSSERERVLRISADFDNFRKRTERERLSFVTNAQGEVVESLLPVLDNFERAKAQIKVETEAEEKINNSYQSIHKQFVEILGSLGVVPVETVGSPFDPMLHEAIMREDSDEFEESIILQEFRKGFKLGDRLLRPSMVKVSAGPGPAKPKEDNGTTGGAEAQSESMEEKSTEEESA